MGSKKNKKQGGALGEEGKQMITDPRFVSAHTDPRFRRVPRRESKVAIDSRFQNVFTDKHSAPVDKRGKRKRRDSGNDSLKEFYRIEEEKKPVSKKKQESESEEEEEEEELKPKAKGKKPVESSEGESEEESEESDEVSESGDEVSEEEDDTDEDDEAYNEEDGFEVLDENIACIDEETHRLAIVNMDWRFVSAKDLYVVLNSFLPKEGRILSVAVYPTDFGLERMKQEEIHGPAIGGGKKNEDEEEEDEDEEEDEEEINRRARDYEKSRLKYYHAVAVCDSSATADFLYKSCDGVEFERSSNKLDLRFIPDSMEFKHPHRDIATEAPSNYGGLDFQSRALQMSKFDISWDEDEPNRIKTLNQKFTPDQLADLEMMEYIASDSDENESDENESDDDNDEGTKLSKKEKKKEFYRALIESGDVDSDNEEEEDNNQDMEATFNTGLEELSKNFGKNKEKKSETVWEEHLRQRREKKLAKKNKQKDDSSSTDDDDDYNIDRKVANNDDNDDFFMEEPPRKKKKEGKMKKKSVSEDEVSAKERANLELILADGNAGDGSGLKGYNIKRNSKKGSKAIAEDKTPEADLNDSRFASVLSDPNYALDPTDPQLKRSATYKRQVAQKQKEDPREHKEVKASKKEELNSDGNIVSKRKDLELSSSLRSLKMKIKNTDSDKKKAGNAETTSTLARRIKKKVEHLSKN